MKLVESNFLLENSKEMLSIINDFYIKSLEEKEISIVLKLKIKHFLEDIKSSFDYASFYIYKKYCIDHIKAKPEDHERQVCFPVHHTEKRFNSFMMNIFPNLDKVNPNLISTMRRVQPFLPDNEKWYEIFNVLVNKNKHRYLTPQSKEEVNMIRTFDEKGESKSFFKHGAVSVNNSQYVFIDGMPWDQQKQLPIPSYNRGYQSEVWANFIFTELGLSVMPTLELIQLEAEKIISDLETFMQ